MPKLSKLSKHRKLSHKDFRGKVCIFCFERAQRPLSKGFIESFNDLKEQLDFDLNDLKTPAGICNACTKKYSKAQGGFGVENFVHKNFNFVNLSDDLNGNCAICLKAKQPTVKKNLKTIGRPRVSPLFRSAVLDLNEEIQSGPKMSICLRCQTKVPTWKFKEHVCSNRVLIKNLVQSTSKPKIKRAAESFASSTIKSAKKSPKGSIRLSQPDGGRKLALTLGAAKEKSQREKMTVAQITKLKREGNLSERSTRKVAAAINKSFKKGSIETNYKKEIAALNKFYDNFIKISRITVDDKSLNLIHVEDLSEYCLKICQDREVDPQRQLFRFSADKGQNKTTFSLSIVDLDEDENVSSKYKTSGVNKMHIFAVVKAEESYNLLNQVLNKVNFYDCKYIFVADLKIIMPLCGLMTCASNWPCYACEVHKENLDDEGEPRTAQSLLERNEKYEQNLLEPRPKPPKDPEFKGSKNRPLLVKEGETNEEFLSKTVLSLIPPPALHLMLGIVADIYKLLLAQWPGAKEWSDALNVWPEEGGPRNRFNGNDCVTLLNNLNELEFHSLVEGKFQLIQPIINALGAFNEMRNACFSKELDPNYVQILDNYWDTIKELNATFGLSITPKIHISYFHIKKWCTDNKSGLGLHSEGPHESIHSRFEKCWIRRKVRPENPNWPEKMRQAVVYFNSNSELD